MNTSLTKSLWLLGFSIVLCCGLFPLVIWSVGQLLFYHQANGSLIYQLPHDAVASELIAQSFSRPEYFHPRPSATDYNTTSSSASNLAPTNPALRQRIVNTLARLAKDGITAKEGPIPADAVMASDSGLDPWISLDYANRQLDRVSQRWAILLDKPVGVIRADVTRLLQEQTHSPLGGLAGTPIVNVMILNAHLTTWLHGSPHE